MLISSSRAVYVGYALSIANSKHLNLVAVTPALVEWNATILITATLKMLGYFNNLLTGGFKGA
jgi:hypothetical protein